MKRYSNQAIADILYEMASLYEMLDVQFKPGAYEKAALNIESYPEEIADIYCDGGVKALDRIPGVGTGIAGHIKDLLETGHFREYEALKKKIPVQINELTAIEGVGPRTVQKLWEELGIRNLDDLEKAARKGKVRELSGFGKKSEERILKGIEFLQSNSGRSILGFVLADLESLEKTISKFPEVDQVTIAGSVRRYKETIGDVDILVSSKKPEKVMERFVRLPDVSHIYGHGETKTNVRLSSNLDADLRVVPAESWGAALCYFTGSKAHNIALRNIAIKKGWKLNEYGIYKDKQQLAGKTEKGLYKKLGLDFVESELRENHGEITTAQEHKLPKLVGYEDLKGDLQTQTNWTDGKNSIEEMALAAEAAGLEYIVITDHTNSLVMTNGLDEKRLKRQMSEIDKINKKLANNGHSITVLKGAEVNIMKDGILDIEDDTLSELDVVGAAIHGNFDLPQKNQTKRIITAMENPNVDIIFHLTTRLINRRRPIDLDIDKIIKAARKTATIMEIDAYPDRLDINDEIVKRCVEAGVKLAVDSDAHATAHFSYLKFGIAQARRGWAERRT
ncbi:MAG: DNA polymerase/3'-5' exonuclease PolX [Gammaproteobacteria bacterium]|nr:DNA polymerase/3'-5' exonuclease PolX [Gammaproteobacteria bacterium]